MFGCYPIEFLRDTIFGRVVNFLQLRQAVGSQDANLFSLFHSALLYGRRDLDQIQAFSAFGVWNQSRTQFVRVCDAGVLFFSPFLRK